MGHGAWNARRLVFVHAHPDDESLITGVSLARAVADGLQVTLVTCTRGEQGEVIGDAAARLTADREDALGEYRVGELAAAAAALGVSDHRFLGDLPDGTVHRRYRDSGMAFDATGTIVLPDDARPEAFCRADLDEAAGDLVAVLRAVGAEAVVTYDAGGGSGHPDHVRTHRVARLAAEVAGCALFAVVVPESVAAQEDSLLAGAGNPYLPGVRRLAPVVPDAAVDVTVAGTPDDVARKVAALRAHATQVHVAEPFFALSDGVGGVIAPVEHFQRLR